MRTLCDLARANCWRTASKPPDKMWHLKDAALDAWAREKLPRPITSTSLPPCVWPLTCLRAWGLANTPHPNHCFWHMPQPLHTVRIPDRAQFAVCLCGLRAGNKKTSEEVFLCLVARLPINGSARPQRFPPGGFAHGQPRLRCWQWAGLIPCRSC